MGGPDAPGHQKHLAHPLEALLEAPMGGPGVSDAQKPLAHPLEAWPEFREFYVITLIFEPLAPGALFFQRSS